MINRNRLNELEALLSQLPAVGDNPRGVTINAENASIPEVTPEEVQARDNLNNWPIEEFRLLKGVTMLGKSFYPNESWDAIRADVSTATHEDSVDYMLGFGANLLEYIRTGITRAKEQQIEIVED